MWTVDYFFKDIEINYVENWCLHRFFDLFLDQIFFFKYVFPLLQKLILFNKNFCCNVAYSSPTGKETPPPFLAKPLKKMAAFQAPF